MARTAVTVTTLSATAQNTFTLAAVGQAVDATDSHSITPPAGSTPEELFLMVVNTTASEKTATVLAGDNPPAVGSAAGNVVVTLAAGNSTATHALFPLNSTRFLQSDGTIHVDIAASMTGRIACFWMKRNV